MNQNAIINVVKGSHRRLAAAIPMLLARRYDLQRHVVPPKLTRVKPLGFAGSFAGTSIRYGSVPVAGHSMRRSWEPVLM